MDEPILPDTLASTYLPEHFIPTKSVGYLIKLLHLSIQKAIEAEMAGLSLTALQWKPLLTLSKNDKLYTISDLALTLALDTPCTTRLVERLVQKGFIERHRSETDRRVVYLALTPEGLDVCQKIPERIARALEQHLHSVSFIELEQFKALAIRMLNNASPDFLRLT